MDYEKLWKELRRGLGDMWRGTGGGTVRSETLRDVIDLMDNREKFPFPDVETSYSIPKGTVMMGYWKEINGKLEFKELGRIENIKVDNETD